MPKLVAVHELYYHATGITADVDSDLVAGLRAELPWLPERSVTVSDFQKFAALFGVSNRKASAFYAKYQWWDVRNGHVQYHDEPDTDH